MRARAAILRDGLPEANSSTLAEIMSSRDSSADQVSVNTDTLRQKLLPEIISEVSVDGQGPFNAKRKLRWISLDAKQRTPEGPGLTFEKPC
jgi:hypothetical protein